MSKIISPKNYFKIFLVAILLIIAYVIITDFENFKDGLLGY